MTVLTQIEQYIEGQSEAKKAEMRTLHLLVLETQPNAQLWFLDGKDESGKVVSNPNIGYGLRTITYANGRTKPFYQIGMSANSTGISVYIMGLADKKHLAETYGKTLGKATISGYCLKFKTLKDIDINVLEAAIREGFAT